jgi:hypothetical protein
VSVHDGVFDSSLVADNLVRDTLFYLSPKLKGPNGSPMLFLFGYSWASDPGALQVFALNEAGDPVVVFSSKTFELMAMDDLDGDGLGEMIGKHSLTQCGGCDGCTYDPYAVYSFAGTEAAPAKYRLDLSRRFNQMHYVWAGRRASESVRVNQCTVGKYSLNRSQ